MTRPDATRFLFIPVLMMAAALAVAVFNREPGRTTYRTTWCPAPALRERTPLDDDPLIERLREIRRKAAELPEAADDAAWVAGIADDLDRKLLTLITNIQLRRRPGP